ncbi:hypothetical protein [Nostoc sp. TCL240-02]|uniref:hypothetical protein n=1 Tax=Nostoc sp. TCL240-02 TaxID=2572090 RepID=UPI00157F9621|nr:hypothetical protein [Nostoc sp. TCL240-02]QKQ73837.1 hypothetical protein FBB35_11235 [Nostoc sp. TCL240-02]
MSNQITMSDLLVDLSTEQQQLLAGGNTTDGDTGNGDTGDTGDTGNGDTEATPVPKFFIRGIVSLRPIRGVS